MSDINQRTEQGILQLTLNRPQKKNALSQQMYLTLTAETAAIRAIRANFIFKININYYKNNQSVNK